MSPERWFCLFRGDAGPMAVPAESVDEILDGDRMVRLAWSPPQVAGLCPHHRDVIPVVRFTPAPSGAGAEPEVKPEPPIPTDPSGARQDTADQDRCILLILTSKRGAWGIRSDSSGTIMSRECPESHPPRTDGDGLVLVGTILHAGTRYGVLDTEATWHGLQSAIGRWYRLIGEPESSPPIAPGDGPWPPARESRERTVQSEPCRGGT